MTMACQRKLIDARLDNGGRVSGDDDPEEWREGRGEVREELMLVGLKSVNEETGRRGSSEIFTKPIGKGEELGKE
jgi:hypothetical protein